MYSGPGWSCRVRKQPEKPIPSGIGGVTVALGYNQQSNQATTNYSGWASAMMTTAVTSEQTRTAANAGFVPVATLAEPNDVEPAQPRVQVPGVNPPAPINHVDLGRIRQAAFRVKTLHPDPIGICVAAELNTWAELGFRLGSASAIGKLVDHIMALPWPEPEAAAA